MILWDDEVRQTLTGWLGNDGSRVLTSELTVQKAERVLARTMYWVRELTN